MKFAVVYSKKDEAGMNIAECLSRRYLPHVPMIDLKEDSVYNENIDEDIPELRYVDLIIFATKHQSKADIPSLSLHAPGNWRNADYGGKPGKICSTSNLALKFLFQKLSENAKQADYKGNITLECTHHGPLLKKVPCCFIEIGSNESHWKNKKLGEIIAETISNFQDFSPDRSIKSAIAIGGPHYCPNFNKIQLSKDSNIAIGHIIPEYALPLTESMLKEAMEKTKENPNIVLVDWKGCGNSESRQKVIEIIEKLGLPHERTERIQK